MLLDSSDPHISDCHCAVRVYSAVSDSVTPWAVALQASLSVGFFRQEYSSGLPCPSPVDLSDPRIEPKSPALAGIFFTTQPPGKPPFVRGGISKCPSQIFLREEEGKI